MPVSLVTVTSTVPASDAGAVAVIEVSSVDHEVRRNPAEVDFEHAGEPRPGDCHCCPTVHRAGVRIDTPPKSTL